jgi:hypothetical protein
MAWARVVRQQFEGEGGGAGGGDRPDVGRVTQRIEQCDHGLGPGEISGTQRADGEDEVGPRRTSLEQLGAGCGVGGVGESGRLAGPLWDQDFVSGGDQVLDFTGNESDASFPRQGFAVEAELHRREG